MATEHAIRTARRRRWTISVPVIVALLFATTTTVAATVGTEAALGAGHVPAAIQIVGAAAQQAAAGQRPDVPIIKRAGSWSAAHDVGLHAWGSPASGTAPNGYWHRRHDADGRNAAARHEAYQGRGPPGRRAAHVLS